MLALGRTPAGWRVPSVIALTGRATEWFFVALCGMGCAEAVGGLQTHLVGEGPGIANVHDRAHQMALNEL